MPLQLIWKPLVLQYLRRQHRREPELYHGWSWNDIIRWNEDLVITDTWLNLESTSRIHPVSGN